MSHGWGSHLAAGALLGSSTRKVEFYGPTVPGTLKGHAVMTYSDRIEKKFYNGEHGYCC